MKKIVVIIFVFLSVIIVQVLYIDYRLGQKLNDIDVEQTNLSYKVSRVEFQTELSSIKLYETLYHPQYYFSEDELIFAFSDTTPVKTKSALIAAY